MTERIKTGWPAPALMQDDDRGLSKWFASQPGARRQASEALRQAMSRSQGVARHTIPRTVSKT